MRVQSVRIRFVLALATGFEVVLMGMPRVYHEPGHEDDEEELRPSAAREPGGGMLGIVVRMVSLIGS